MMSPPLIRNLCSLLNEETELLGLYAKLLVDEKDAMVAFDSDKVGQLSFSREQLHLKLVSAQDRRMQVLKKISGEGPLLKLSAIQNEIKDRALSREYNAAFALFKKTVDGLKGASSELGSLSGFSLGLVSSLISIVTSSSHNVVKGYNSFGTKKENYQALPSQCISKSRTV